MKKVFIRFGLVLKIQKWALGQLRPWSFACDFERLNFKVILNVNLLIITFKIIKTIFLKILNGGFK